MAPKRFTLDTNCIIDVEDERPDASFVRELAALHGSGVNIAVSCIGASERRRDGGYAKTFSEFQTKIAAAGLCSLELLPPIAYLDICYWDFAILPAQTDVSLERSIHDILFPDMAFSWAAYAMENGLQLDRLDAKWRNAKCDVLTLWCHIKHGSGVFVTSDGNFHAASKVEGLRAIGAGVIARPRDALRIAKSENVSSRRDR
jgi:hypothetical protein